MTAAAAASHRATSDALSHLLSALAEVMAACEDDASVAAAAETAAVRLPTAVINCARCVAVLSAARETAMATVTGVHSTWLASVGPHPAAGPRQQQQQFVQQCQGAAQQLQQLLDVSVACLVSAAKCVK